MIHTPQYWATVEQQDERRHRYLLARESEVVYDRYFIFLVARARKEISLSLCAVLSLQSIAKIEGRIERMNDRVLTGDFVIARLGEAAHRKAAISDAKQYAAIQHVSIKNTLLALHVSPPSSPLHILHRISRFRLKINERPSKGYTIGTTTAMDTGPSRIPLKPTGMIGWRLTSAGNMTGWASMGSSTTTRPRHSLLRPATITTLCLGALSSWIMSMLGRLSLLWPAASLL